MKKHLFILGLALALFNVGCDDQNTIPSPMVMYKRLRKEPLRLS